MNTTRTNVFIEVSRISGMKEAAHLLARMYDATDNPMAFDKMRLRVRNIIYGKKFDNEIHQSIMDEIYKFLSYDLTFVISHYKKFMDTISGQLLSC